MNFDAALEFVLSHEAGYVDNPNDSGGPTNMGVTLMTLSAFLGRAVLLQELKDLSRETAAEIYRKGYWNAAGLNSLVSDRVCLAMFDHAVMSGPDAAIRGLQKTLGVTVDGNFGPATAEAANACVGPDLAIRLTRSRVSGFVDICKIHPEKLIFLKGWLNRALDLIEAIHKGETT